MKGQGIPVWVIFLATLALAAVSVEVGYRRARYKQAQAEREGELEKEAPVGAMVGASLGLLALLLAFTFGMAADHFQARKAALLGEASAIRTAYLQAELIPEAQRSEVRAILRDYVDERIVWAGVERSRPVRSPRDLLDRLWIQTAGAAEKSPRPAVVSDFVQTVSRIVAFNDERVFLRERSRIPGAFWAVLYLVAFLSFAAMGYHGGVSGTSRSPVMLAVAIVFSLVMALIVDLDRPGDGWVRVNQDAMVELRDWMSPPKH